MAATTAADNFKATSCEGYVTKRGHYVKSWRVRYLVLNGSDLKVAYYNSKDAYQNKADAKGWFYLSSIEKHDYNIGLVANDPKPFGFKMVGHAPAHGYMELDVYVDCLQDLMKWVNVAHNALEAAKHLVAPSPNVSPVAKGRLLHEGAAAPPAPAPAATSQQQVQKCHETKEQLLKSALQEIQAAKAVGNEACVEIVQQSDTLDHVEMSLGKANSDLDYGDTLLKKMQHPILHMFMHSPTNKSAKGGTGTSPLTPPKPPVDAQKDSSSPVTKSASPPMDDLELLSQALDDLEHQATVLKTEAVKSTEQVSLIEQKMADTTNRVQAQTTKANKIRNAGHLF